MNNPTDLLKPFSAFRPKSYQLDQILAPTSDQLRDEEIPDWISGKPNHFLRITRSLPEEAAHLFRAWCEEGVFERDSENAYYLYELESNGHRQRGWVGSFDLTQSERVRTLEQVPDQAVNRSRDYLEIFKMHTTPVPLFYREKTSSLKDLAEQIVQKQKPLYAVQTPEGVWHRVFAIYAEDLCAQIAEHMQGAGPFYVAEGQHRYQAALQTGAQELLVAMFPSDELQIEGYHRWIPEPHCTFQGLIQFLGRYCVFETIEKLAFPREPEEMILQWQGKPFRLRFRYPRVSADRDKSDVQHLQDFFLKPFLKIDDVSADPRIQCVGGKTLSELAQLKGLLILMYPVALETLFQFSDAHQTLPARSTWFAPKLADGMWVLPVK